MSRKVGNVFFVYPEVSQVCEVCGQVAETRPYYKDGKEICYACAQKPENKKEVEKNMAAMMTGKKKMPIRNDLAKDEKTNAKER